MLLSVVLVNYKVPQLTIEAVRSVLALSLIHIYRLFWWTGVDSNHRKRSWQIYSLLPLATREPVHRPSVLRIGAYF